ncbi:hypothetical protein EAF04_002310 [Stromatinia cepivora]|nr:hypothetical protein EAF04_002310 [Stromatinia cepivora]
MSQITLQPTGLKDAGKSWIETIDDDDIQGLIKLAQWLPPDFVTYVVQGNARYLFPSDDPLVCHPPEPAAKLFENFGRAVDMGKKITDNVFPSYDKLGELFYSYATEAHNHYAQVLDILGKIRTEILENSSIDEDCEKLSAIVATRTDLSGQMKEAASDVVNSFLEIQPVLRDCESHIDQNLKDLVRLMNSADRPDIPEVWALEQIGYEATSAQAMEITLWALGPIGTAITEMQKEIGLWDAINHDLIAMQDLITEEKDTAAQIIATLDNEQILERWQEIGDMVPHTVEK